MSAIATSLTLVSMARKEASPTSQINFRLKDSTIEKMEEHKRLHHLHPTLTQIVEAAVVEYLSSHAGEVDRARKK